ncbi:MAG: hypothetical protein Q9224_007357 [Gallowayella concinna]
MSQADLDRSRELFRALNSSIPPIAPTIWTPRPDDFLPGTTGPWNPSEMPRQHISPASHTGPWNPPWMPRHDPFARSAVDWRRRPTPNRFGTIGDGRPVRTQVIGATIVPVPVRPRGRDDNAAMEQGSTEREYRRSSFPTTVTTAKVTRVAFTTKTGTATGISLVAIRRCAMAPIITSTTGISSTIATAAATAPTSTEKPLCAPLPLGRGPSGIVKQHHNAGTQ